MRACTTRHPTVAAATLRLVVLAAGAALLLGACGATTPIAHVGTGLASAHAHPRVTAPTTTAPTTTVPPTTAPPTTTTPPTTAPPPADVAGQEVVVRGPSAGATTAVLTAYQRTTAGWRVAFGPFTAHIGYDGFAPPGAKHEGDGRTPSGTFGFGFAFGVDSDPGLRLPYRPVTGPNIVWDDDPSSPRYNQWVDTSTADPGADPEPMDNTPAYDYGAVIDYNTSPVVPGAGSAIFLHVSTGGPTAGCVSLPMDELLEVLRWLDPAQSPTIVMGLDAAPS